MASITTSRGASMDPEEVKRALQNDPSLFQQFMGMLGLGGGQAQQANPQVTGDIGMNPVVTGNVGANAPVGTGSVRLTGDVGDTSASRAGGGGSSSIPPMGSASGRTAPSGAGGGGGGRPPVKALALLLRHPAAAVNQESTLLVYVTKHVPVKRVSLCWQIQAELLCVEQA